MKAPYPSLSPDQRRKEHVGSKALDELFDHLQSSPNTVDVAFRRSSIQAILSDLTACLSGGTDWSVQNILSALASLKLLGRSSVATEDLVSHFPLLLTCANLLPPTSIQLHQASHSSVKSIPHSPAIVQESLRILANALFLHPLSRSSADLLSALNPLVELAVSPPDKTPRPGSDMDHQSHEIEDTTSFLASRVIFLITAVPSNLVVELIERTGFISNLKKAFQQELAQKLDPEAHSLRYIYREALSEYLKIIFNVMIHFPKSILAFDHNPLDAINPSTVSTSPPLNNPEHGSSQYSPSTAATSPASPRRRSILKQRFNNQINFKKFRFRNSSETSDSQDHQQDPPAEEALDGHGFLGNSFKKNFFRPSHSSNSKVDGQSSGITDDTQELLSPITSPVNNVFAGLLPHLVQLFLLEPIPQPPNLKPPFNSYMQTFLNFLPSAYCFFDSYSNLPSHLFSSWDPKIPPLINKLIMIIERVTEYYCPDDPDDRSVKQKCQADGIDLDVDLTQVLLLTANLISPHPATDASPTRVGLTNESREALIERIIPSKLDRSIGLNKQANLIGRLLRLMNSVGFEMLKQTCGGFLQALYADDTDLLAAQVGYGPLAGYFLSIGKPALNPENNKHSSNPDINPITGTYWNASEDTDAQFSKSSTFSDDEKEREAERLCDLFERMNRGGVISVEDPRKLAVQSGRFEEIENSVGEAQAEEDKAEEEEALRDLARYKEKKAKMVPSNS